MDTSVAPANGFKVAIVGSGPGGIACADELAKRGYAVTVLEASDMAGGLLVNGIPAFKLQKSVVERRLDILRARGVDIRVGVRLGQDVSLGRLREEYDAVFLASGPKSTSRSTSRGRI